MAIYAAQNAGEVCVMGIFYTNILLATRFITADGEVALAASI
jgi:hypothetical protein